MTTEQMLNLIRLPGAIYAAGNDGGLPERIGGTAMLWDEAVTWWPGFTRELAAGCITAEMLDTWANQNEGDVLLLRQHDPNLLLARQASDDRTLTLTVTDTGLDWLAPIAADSPVSAAAGADVRDGLLTACSFMGQITRSEWIESDEGRHQRITELRLREVTACVWPRWASTTATVAASTAPILGTPGIEMPEGAPPERPDIDADAPPAPSPEPRDSPPTMSIAAALAATTEL